MNTDIGPHTSFSARRPNASNLPHFELPSPHLSTFSRQGYGNPSGQLLTPPTGSSFGSQEKPSSHVAQPSYPYTPTGQWPANTQNNTYSFPAVTSPDYNHATRGEYSQDHPHSTLRRSETMPEQHVQPQSPFADTHSYSTGMHAPAPLTLPTLQSSFGSHSASMNTNDSYGRPLQSPTFYNSAQPSPGASYGAHFSAGHSPIAHTPVDHALPRHSPGILGTMPPLSHAHTTTPPANYPQRPFSYPISGPMGLGSPTSQFGMGGVGFPGLSAYNSQQHQMQMHQYGASAPHAIHNERPFRCDQCPQSFNRNHDLKRHKRIHLAVKPFPCGHCDKSFSRKDALKVSQIDAEHSRSPILTSSASYPCKGLWQGP